MTPGCPKAMSRSSDSLGVRWLDRRELQEDQEHPTVETKKGRKACPSSFLPSTGLLLNSLARATCPKASRVGYGDPCEIFVSQHCPPQEAT